MTSAIARASSGLVGCHPVIGRVFVRGRVLIGGDWLFEAEKSYDAGLCGVRHVLCEFVVVVTGLVGVDVFGLEAGAVLQEASDGIFREAETTGSLG